MGIPAFQKARIGAYIARQLLSGRRRFPLVLMLEPLFRCNLRCPGCGKIDRPAEVLARQMSVEECAAAAEECGAPVVSIPGGEPLLHPDIHAIVRSLLRMGKFVYLCTNGLLVERRLHEFAPSPRLSFNVHIDGLGERHDAAVGCEGACDRAVQAIRLLVARGFRVTTNSTFFGGETPDNVARLFDVLAALGVEGMTAAAAFRYGNAPGDARYLDRAEINALFSGLLEAARGRKWAFNHSPLYLEFLAGRRDYACTPWGTPTRNIFGWQVPCYLLDDGYAPSFRALMEGTAWGKYGAGRDPRCAGCTVHSGFEPSAVLDAVRHPLAAAAAALRQSVPAPGTTSLAARR